LRPSEQIGVSDFPMLYYDKKQKLICDLSNMKDGDISLQTVDLENNPATKHLEIDFRRDENGNVVFEDSQSSRSEPAALVGPASFRRT
jgi:hypothetical protein